MAEYNGENGMVIEGAAMNWGYCRMTPHGWVDYDPDEDEPEEEEYEEDEEEEYEEDEEEDEYDEPDDRYLEDGFDPYAGCYVYETCEDY